ncbi:MAG: SGNH/GDSL hydrolase family protein [Planctomycetales bacterium]
MRSLRLSAMILSTVVILSASLEAADNEFIRYDRSQTLKMLPELHLLDPVWKSPIIYGESSTLLQLEKDGPITGRLAFPAQKIFEVRTADRKRTLEEGTDYTLAEDKRTLTIKPKSKLLFLTERELYPREKGPSALPYRVGHPEQFMLHMEGHFFHTRQIEVTYRPAPNAWTGPVPQLAEKQLPKTFARLRAGKSLTLGVSGDSITYGLNASALANWPPNQPAYAELVAAQLQDHYKVNVDLENRAVSGWSILHGITDLNQLLKEKPHLLIVAYGMNDVGRKDPKWFKEQNQTFLDKVRKADPEIEVILVASMLGNKEWIATPREMFALYRDELKSLTGPGVALADVTSVWTTFLQHKQDLDLLGNGLNHPTDFGHRLYAQTILSLLIPPQANIPPEAK